MKSSASEVRRRILDACRTLADEGFLPGTGGNIAMRIDESAFAVTPSAADYYTMSPEDICVLDLKTLKRIDARKKPSVESGLHARLLRFRPDFSASIHTHQPIASGVALINQSIPILPQSEASRLGPVVPVVPYAPSGTWFLARAFEKTLTRSSNGYLLRNHGIVCGGKDMEDAMDNVRLLEKVAAQFLKERMKSHDANGNLGDLVRRILSEATFR
ncbi:class II aldolase/adducin family protein [bacterium]|nr:class II aldolase/adducin family protein [bacterium]